MTSIETLLAAAKKAEEADQLQQAAAAYRKLAMLYRQWANETDVAGTRKRRLDNADLYEQHAKQLAAGKAARPPGAHTEPGDKKPPRTTPMLQEPRGAYVAHGPMAAPRVIVEDRVRALETKVTALEKDLEQLQQFVSEAPGDVVVLRTVSREEAKREIVGLFRSGEALDQADVAQRLSLDLMLAAELCDELVDEGAVKYADDAD